ncbi:MAG: hypothetical protein EZS28_014516 [Streblomastix strix]|uniref:Uncharacterized protein n=1 Tax=Streblomastix strix TaxID=222440 RepID=A0A5J4W515_9EUKA|nr:MAG: hypothetical protein EZS28_014516 [Streblomastix strix]
MPAEYTAFCDKSTKGIQDFLELIVLLAAILTAIFILLWTIIYQCCGNMYIQILDHLRIQKTSSIVTIVIGDLESAQLNSYIADSKFFIIAGFFIVNGILASSLFSILFSFINIYPDFIGDKEYLSPVHMKRISSSGNGECRTFASNDLISYMLKVAVDYEMRKNDSYSMRGKPVIVGE